MKFLSHDSYCEVIFHSEKTRNGFGLTESAELLKLARTAIKNKIPILIFRNEGFHFSAGGDLQSVLKLKTKKAGTDLNSKIEKNLDLFFKLPLLKVALVDGDCFGGGIELLSCFDLRFALSSSCFGFFQKRFSLTTGWGGYARWQQQGAVGLLPALAGGQMMSAYEAYRLGLVHSVYSSEEREMFVQRLLHDLGSDSSRLNALALLNQNSKLEKKVFNQLWWSEGHLGGLSKFKRK